LTAGSEPGRGRPTWLPRPRVGSSARRRLAAAGIGALLVVLAAGGAVSWWSGRSDEVSAPGVAIDTSEYFLPHDADRRGRAELVLLLRVAPPSGSLVAHSQLTLVGLRGGGLFTAGSYQLPLGAAARVAVRGTLDCTAWRAGHGVRVRFREDGTNGVTTVDVPLDLGPGSAVHEQLQEACTRWQANR
jgi:hypothetical protein